MKKLYSSSRVEALTDGIFGFAMTLLVLDLHVPKLGALITNNNLIHALTGLDIKFFSFLLSFILLASAWGVHHRQFDTINKVDNTLVWLNNFRLIFVVFVPFATSLVSEYPTLTAAVFLFSINMFFMTFIGFLQWKHAAGHNLAGDLTQAEKNDGNVRNQLVLAVDVLAIALSFVNPNLALWSFMLIPVGLGMVKYFSKE